MLASAAASAAASDAAECSAESSSRINENLADRRVRIQKLNGVRRLLKKLSFIFELPTRLKRAVELDAGAEAVLLVHLAAPNPLCTPFLDF